MSRTSRRDTIFQILTAATSVAMPTALSGCGTLLYPERRGQPKGGKVDWTVVGMDSIGLFFFFIPGVIAFAIDYGNGSMFLPPENVSGVKGRQPLPAMGDTTEFHRVALPSDQPSSQEIEAALLRERQLTVRLDDESVIRRPIKSLTDFWRLERTFRSETAKIS
ncbi:MAG: hypothetical protein JNL58_21480 [Planctomyces sp.]|nr:hypothetical protein [Planctomyces sp.]